MEQFKVVHNSRVKARNRLESIIVSRTKSFLNEPVPMTLEEVYEKIEKEIKEYSIRLRQKGVRVSDIEVFCRYVGEESKVMRSFSVYGRGRGTYTLLIQETIAKDSKNSFKPFEKQ